MNPEEVKSEYAILAGKYAVAEKKLATAESYLVLIGGTCGVPDASEACRIINKRAKEALKKIRGEGG